MPAAHAAICCHACPHATAALNAVSSSSHLGAGGAPAELSNPLHPRGAIQPHGLLLVLRGPELRIVQASANAGPLLRRPLDSLLLATLRDLGNGLDARVHEVMADSKHDELQWLAWRAGSGPDAPAFEGHVHRIGPDLLVLELEPSPAADAAAEEAQGRELLRQLGAAVSRFSSCPSVEALADSAAQAVRTLTGHATVQVRACEETGRAPWQVRALARADDGSHDRSLALHAGAHGAGDLGPEAQARHLRQRVRLLADLQRPAVELVPQRPADSAGHDLTRSRLRAASASCTADLTAQGVRAALSVAVVREGRLWGLIEARHGGALHLDSRRLAACELLAEAMATRITALESHARAALAVQVRMFEQRLLAAAAADGDWRAALRHETALLLQPLGARSAVLLHDGVAHACGESPDGPGLRTLCADLKARAVRDGPVYSAWWQLPKDQAQDSGRLQAVLAVALSASRTDWMLWLRPGLPDARPGGAPWSAAEQALAQAYGNSLADLIVQIDAVRLLIAQQQLARVRDAVAGASDAVVVAGPGEVFANAAFLALTGCRPEACASLDALAALFTEPAQVQAMLGQVCGEQRAWRGELVLRAGASGDGSGGGHGGGCAETLDLPVAVRAEPVPSHDAAPLGTVFVFTDLRAAKRAEAARQQLEAALSRAAHGARAAQGSDAAVEKALVGALVTNASLAAMDIADGSPTPTMAPLLQEIGASTARATALLAHIRRLA